MHRIPLFYIFPFPPIPVLVVAVVSVCTVVGGFAHSSSLGLSQKLVIEVGIKREKIRKVVVLLHFLALFLQPVP